MNPCIYRSPVDDPERFACSNRKDLLHSGTVPALICKSCPYAKPTSSPLDYFAATQELFVLRALSGEYVAKPRSCGGCNTVKHRSETLQFVWPFWAGGANGDELRWSIRSVQHHYEGKAKITIVGDRPEWWQGHVINKPRIAQSANWPFRDMLSKMWTIATHREIDSEFVWMMDDVYLIKPCDFNDIQTPRAYGWNGSKATSWQRRKANTMQALANEGKTQHDYATHLPHYAEQSKLREIYERHDLHNNTMLWEVLYGNTFRGRPEHPHPFFARINKRMDLASVKKQCRAAFIMNHAAHAWCEGIREYLEELLPDPATGEVEVEGYKPEFIKRGTTKLIRHVKRRPRHTHRKVIERQNRERNTSPDDHSGGVH